MPSVTAYKTKQRGIIEKALIESGGEHVTVDSLASLLAGRGESVGRTTVYRQLEKLTELGKVRKYTPAAGESVCYQYVGDSSCSEHFHLKCSGCGRLIHVECEKINDMCEHIGAEHNFKIDMLKTVLYGTCEECSGK